MRPKLALLAAIAVVLAAAAPSASAAGAMQLSEPDTRDYPNVGFILTLPAESGVEPEVFENDIPVGGLEVQSLGDDKAVAILIDRSSRFAGEPLNDAIEAARVYVDAKGDDDRIALFGFSSQAIQLTEFSESTDEAESVLGTLKGDPKQGTALFRAVGLAARALAREELAARVIVVLSDGRNYSRLGSLESAVATSRAAGASVYTFAISSAQFSPEPMKELAANTGGEYFEATSSGALVGLSEALTKQLQRTWRVQYAAAARPGDKVRLLVEHPQFGSAATSFRIPLSVGTPDDPSPVARLLYESNAGTWLLAALVGGLILLAACFALAAWNVTRLRRRLEPHVQQSVRATADGAPPERFALAKRVFSATDATFGQLRAWRSLARWLERADLPLTAAEFSYVMVGCGLALAILLALTGAPKIVLLAMFALGATLPLGFLRLKAGRRLKAFDDQLPDLLMTIAASLKAGHTFRHGMQTAAEEAQEPASKEFQRVIFETGLGRPMDQALAEMAERLGSKNFDYVISVVAIQRSVGGSLAGLFDMVSETVRQRQQFQKKVRSLTAMGRMSAYVLVGLPFLLGLALTAINSEYMGPLFSTGAGRMMMMIGLSGMALGALCLKRIVSFKE
jgi:tight adherence protein B